jgi:CHAT domain-containing protein
MGELYRGFSADPGEVSRALQRAQETLRAVNRDGAKPYAHPYYWAGFVVSGR